MTTGKRIALLAAVVVVAVVGFIVLKPDDDEKKGGTAANTAETTQQQTTTDGGPAKPAKPKPPPIPQVTVRGGKPVGGVKTIKADKGEKIEFVVKSDVADHVHVHGYDLMQDVEPGRQARFVFNAKIDGIYEIELEDRGLLIAELEVQP
jgi:heme/copper-type cytochrome/quinol oxidase subunit 2